MATTDKPHILIADDQRDVREALRLLLKSEGWNCSTEFTGRTFIIKSRPSL